MEPLPRRSRNEGMDWAELARADVTVPTTPQDVEKLAESITHRKRDFWIVVLTARRLEAMPSMPPMTVREIVGPNVPIVHLKSHLATHLQTLLPPGLGVYSGALRVYRAGIFDDPFAHPLLYDETGEYGEDVLTWLGRIFTPNLTRPPRLSPKERVVVLEHALEKMTLARRRETKILRRRYEALIAADRPRGFLLPWGKGKPPRMESELRELVAEQWASCVPVSQREKYPLRRYTVTSRFIKDLHQGIPDVPLDEIACVCALVLCRFRVEAAGLSLGKLRSFAGAPQMSKADGAKAWWCSLTRGETEIAPRIVWWANRDGTVELVACGIPKEGS
jgi:hypothetical protein